MNPTNSEPVASAAQRRGDPTDEVDALIAAWARERTDLALAPLEVFSRLTRLARRLDRIRRAAFATAELEPWEFDVLAALRREGEPYQLSPGKLLQATMVTSGTMTNRVDRLSHRGLVQRSPDPNDRRGVLVSLTAAGQRCVDGAFEALLAQEHELLSDLAPPQRQQLAQLLKQLLRSLPSP